MDTEDNLRTMLCWHTRYTLGDLYFSNMQELKRYLTELANEFAGDEYKRLLRERIVSSCVVDDRSGDVVNERTVNVRSCFPCTCMSIAGSQCGCPRLRKVGRHARGLHLRPALEGQD